MGRVGTSETPRRLRTRRRRRRRISITRHTSIVARRSCARTGPDQYLVSPWKRASPIGQTIREDAGDEE